jgi:hypothetical protein
MVNGTVAKIRSASPLVLLAGEDVGDDAAGAKPRDPQANLFR